ncbi:sigma-70 family RNA polymerase sigma factor [Telmatocola sphagniphila]|uniref:Sigma-70 family RNA polymerase sigma factor n=1 Tax=Telmatocola sphagniphila TaxID=1123043 RepID=A0A8E6B9X7_9BACT|nr:ECF-type sigma factor [Telmatocola sphagniphila]QVL33846.1 sigma-70 family RNA polymerase sigma factor [Telmatocola sphagniphila]
MSSVSILLDAAAKGDQRAAVELLPQVYEELRKLAASRMASEACGHSLNPTALVHEAYIRLVDTSDSSHWSNRGHFFAAAAEAMRRILVESARRKATLKRGGDRQRRNFDLLAVADESERSVELLAIDEALTELSECDAQTAQLIKLRYFAGLTHQEAADALGITRGVADRLWAVGRAWLYRRINSD